MFFEILCFVKRRCVLSFRATKFKAHVKHIHILPLVNDIVLLVFIFVLHYFLDLLLLIKYDIIILMVYILHN